VNYHAQIKRDDEEIKKIHREAESIRDRFPKPPKRG